MLRKLKLQIPGEPLAARYNWCQCPAVEKHWPKQRQRATLSRVPTTKNGEIQRLLISRHNPDREYAISNTNFAARTIILCVFYLPNATEEGACWKFFSSSADPHKPATGNSVETTLSISHPEPSVPNLNLNLCMYVGFKTFYVVRRLDSTASYLPTGLHLRFFRSWPSL